MLILSLGLRIPGGTCVSPVIFVLPHVARRAMAAAPLRPKQQRWFFTGFPHPPSPSHDPSQNHVVPCRRSEASPSPQPPPPRPLCDNSPLSTLKSTRPANAPSCTTLALDLSKPSWFPPPQIVYVYIEISSRWRIDLGTSGQCSSNRIIRLPFSSIPNPPKK